VTQHSLFARTLGSRQWGHDTLFALGALCPEATLVAVVTISLFSPLSVVSTQETKLGIWNGRILELEQYFCNGKLIELKLRFWSKFESWEILELGELKFIS
jgi:hypothetical protein